MRIFLNIFCAILFLAINVTGQIYMCVCLKKESLNFFSCCCAPHQKNIKTEKDSEPCCFEKKRLKLSKVTKDDVQTLKDNCCEEKEICSFSQVTLEKDFRPTTKKFPVALHTYYPNFKSTLYTYISPKYLIPYNIPPPGIKLYQKFQSYLC